MRLGGFPDTRPFPAGPALQGQAREELLGSWSATRWHYTSRKTPGRTVDVVCDLRGSVTLSLSAGTYILAWEIPGRRSRSIGGTWAARGDTLEYTVPGEDGVESVAFRLGAHELSLARETSSWDFDGNGEDEPAGFVGVFVRL